MCWWMIHALSPFVPLPRELSEMAYLWKRPAPHLGRQAQGGDRRHSAHAARRCGGAGPARARRHGEHSGGTSRLRVGMSDSIRKAMRQEGPPMIVDFQHHFTPRELIKEDPGDRLILHYDAQGAPSYTIHSLLYDLDEHVRMMDRRRHRRGLAHQRAGHVRRPRDLALRQRQGQAGRARLSRPLHRRGACPPARRQRRHQGAQPLPARARLPGRGDHVGDRRTVSRRTRASSRSGPRRSGSACSCSCTRR